MVHCTDIAGSVGCCIGQAKPGHDRISRHAPNGAPAKNAICRALLPVIAAAPCSPSGGTSGSGCFAPTTSCVDVAIEALPADDTIAQIYTRYGIELRPPQ